MPYIEVLVGHLLKYISINYICMMYAYIGMFLNIFNTR